MEGEMGDEKWDERERGEGEWEEKGGEFEQFLLVLFFFLTPLSFFEYLQKKKKNLCFCNTSANLQFFLQVISGHFSIRTEPQGWTFICSPPHSPLFFLIICSLFMLMEFDDLLTLMFHFSVSI